MITLKELTGSRIEVSIDDKVYQVDTLGQREPYVYALNKVLNGTNENIRHKS